MLLFAGFATRSQCNILHPHSSDWMEVLICSGTIHHVDILPALLVSVPPLWFVVTMSWPVGHELQAHKMCCVLLRVQSGLARFPTSAHMVLVYINFLSSVQDNQQACNSQLQAARKLQANWCDR